MKKLILTFGLFFAGLFLANAQDKTEARATKLVSHLTEVCGLTSDQVSKLQPVAENYIKAREANRQQYANNHDSLRIANKAANMNYKSQRDAILTPDQLQKLKAYNAQHRANRKGGQGGDEQGEEQQ